MAKKYYKKQYKKKSTKEIPVCGDCLLDPTDSDLKETDFYWILKHNPEFPNMNYYFLACVNCIEKENYVPAKPYKLNKKGGRPKGSKNNKK
jgi:hypothetical protein